MNAEEIYWLMITQPIEKKEKELSKEEKRKKYQREYYLKHKKYFYSKTLKWRKENGIKHRREITTDGEVNDSGGGECKTG
jgi:hypothetical protein